MNKVVKKVAAMAAAVMMMSTMAMSASASYNYTITDSYQKFYYSGGETTTNYYVTYSQGTNKTAKIRYMNVQTRIYSTAGNKLTGNTSSGQTASGVNREVYARIGASNVSHAYHHSAIRKTDKSSDLLTKYVVKNMKL